MAGEFGFVYCREREPRKRATESHQVELLSRCSAVALLLGAGQKSQAPSPPEQKERNRRVFPTRGLLGLDFFFRDPSCPEQFPTCSRQVSDGPQKTRYVIYM